MGEPRCHPDFALESGKRLRTYPLGRKELDGCFTSEHGVGRAVDNAHPTLAELFGEHVLPDLGRGFDLLAQPVITWEAKVATAVKPDSHMPAAIIGVRREPAGSSTLGVRRSIRQTARAATASSEVAPDTKACG